MTGLGGRSLAEDSLLQNLPQAPIGSNFGSRRRGADDVIDLMVLGAADERCTADA